MGSKGRAFTLTCKMQTFRVTSIADSLDRSKVVHSLIHHGTSRGPYKPRPLNGQGVRIESEKIHRSKR